jgi:hypothetical protein
MWLELVAAAILVAWVMLRYPRLGPHSITRAIACFAVAGAAAPKLGLLALPLALRLPYGVQVAFLGVILPVFFVMFLTIGWLIRACFDALGGPRGGHRVRGTASSGA